MINFLGLSGVYMIRCNVTGERYVGGTKVCFAERFSTHTQALRRGRDRPALQAAHDAHGIGSLEFIVLGVFPPAEVHDREREAIRKLRPEFNRMCQPPRQGDDVIDVEALVKLSGLSRPTIMYRFKNGLRGDDLIAPPHRTKRKEYTRRT